MGVIYYTYSKQGFEKLHQLLSTKDRGFPLITTLFFLFVKENLYISGVIQMTTDEHPKPQTLLAQIAKLPPVFKKGGVVTAAR